MKKLRDKKRRLLGDAFNQLAREAYDKGLWGYAIEASKVAAERRGLWEGLSGPRKEEIVTFGAHVELLALIDPEYTLQLNNAHNYTPEEGEKHLVTALVKYIKGELKPIKDIEVIEEVEWS